MAKVETVKIAALKGDPHNVNSATFLASFAPILTSIKVHGSREGMRIQLDIPESEMGNAMNLFLWRECVLEVTVKPQHACKAEGNSAGMAEGQKRKSKWEAAQE